MRVTWQWHAPKTRSRWYVMLQMLRDMRGIRCTRHSRYLAVGDTIREEEEDVGKHLEAEDEEDGYDGDAKKVLQQSKDYLITGGGG